MRDDDVVRKDTQVPYPRFISAGDREPPEVGIGFLRVVLSEREGVAGGLIGMPTVLIHRDDGVPDCRIVRIQNKAFTKHVSGLSHTTRPTEFHGIVDQSLCGLHANRQFRSDATSCCSAPITSRDTGALSCCHRRKMRSKAAAPTPMASRPRAVTCSFLLRASASSASRVT